MNYQYHYLALSLDGDSVAESPCIYGIPLDGSLPFSMAAWIKVGKNDRKREIIAQKDVFSFYLDKEAVCFQLNGAPVISTDPFQYTVCDEQWHHVCVSVMNSYQFLYLDGILCATVSKTGTAAPRDLPFVFGEGIVGHIREVRIYRKALYEDEVKEIMFDTPNVSQLLAWYDFTQNPPVEKCRDMPIVLKGGAYVSEISPAGNFTGKRFATLPESNRFLKCLSGEYSVQLWVNFSPNGEDGRKYTLLSVCDNRKMEGAILYAEKDNGRYTVKFQHGAGAIPENIVSYPGISASVWTNIAVVKRLNTLSLYVDGSSREGSISESVFPLSGDIEGGQILYIGSDAFSADMNGNDMFEGGISRLDLWADALSAEEVRGFCANSPDPSDVRLVSSCDFTSPVPNNMAGEQPVYEMNGFRVEDKEDEATSGMKEPTALLCDEMEPLTAGQLAELRMKATGLHADRQGASGCLLTVNSLNTGANIYFVFHNDKHSYTVASLTAKELQTQSRRLGMTEEEVVWWVELILMVLGGILLLLFGIQISKSSSIAAFAAQRIIPLAAIRNLPLANIGLDVFVLFIKIIYKENLLLPLLKLALKGIGFFALFRIAANLFKFTTGIFTFLDATLLIIQISNHIKNKPTPLTDIVLDTVLFNHGKASSSLNIRENRKKDIVPGIPEWKGAALQPVLYNTGNFTGGNAITIYCTFSSRQDRENIWVRARDVGSTRIFGDSNETEIRIDRNKSGNVKIEFPSHRLADSGILKEELRLEWEYSNDRKKWKKTGTSNHLIYTVLGNPGYPWGSIDASLFGKTEDYKSKPWLSALDIMYPYVKGVKNLKTLYKKITEAVNCKFGFRYDTKTGAPKYYKAKDSYFHFNLTWCISDMSGGKKAIINCTDCAAIVATFANLYGGRLSICMIGQIGQEFCCYKIQAIGFHEWAYAFPDELNKNGHFSMHQIAVKYTGKDEDNRTTEVYDSCLKVDDSPTPGKPHGNAVLPTGMRFSAQPDDDTFNPNITPLPDNSYREHLAIKGKDGLAKCKKIGNFFRPLK